MRNEGNRADILFDLSAFKILIMNDINFIAGMLQIYSIRC